MENLDLFYRTFEAYKKEISADPESAKFCRISKRQSDIENESLNIIFSTVDIDETWVDAIEEATTDEELTKLYADILKTGFISYKVNPKDIDVNSDEYIKLSIGDKKRLLMELLDKNQLYVNYCDIDDETFKISEEDKAFTRSFYGEV